MPLSRIEQLQQRLYDLARRYADRPASSLEAANPLVPPNPLTVGQARQLFVSQLTARHLDRLAYTLRARGQGYYTIGSAGHESNAVVGQLTRPTDPALLHYRSAAFFLERARAIPGVDPVEAIALGLTASRDEPIAGGRHKVFGHIALGVLPQTSTVASQLPKALGLAMSIDRARRIGRPATLPSGPLPDDAIVVTSLGDASVMHASAATTLQAARWMAHQRLPLPLLIVVEDNGLGISARTPPGWLQSLLGGGPGLRYFTAPGEDLPATYAAASEAVACCRHTRAPTVLHLGCVRLLGHSGADPDTVYRTPRELEAALARDPVHASAALLLEHGALTAEALTGLDAEIAARVDEAGERAVARPKLRSAAEVMDPIARYSPDAVHAEAARADYHEARVDAFGGADKLPERQPKQPLSRLISWCLRDLMAKYGEAIVFGEDVAEKGGVYNVTAGLWKCFGSARVFNTLLDETLILGLAQGAALSGLLPVPEIQYLAFLHNAEDQLRGEAASTSFFSRGQLRTPMVLRVASFGYQKGFGGHFHNDNSLAVLRDVPGLVLAAPANGTDAVGMLRTCFAAARVDGSIACFLEPIALYAQADLLEAGDGQLLGRFPEPGSAIPLGEPAVYGAAGAELTVVTYANGVRLCRRAIRKLERRLGLRARLVDLRWLAPLPVDAVKAEARAAGKLLIVDECRRAGNVGEALAAAIACDATLRHVSVGLVTAKDSFIPLGDAAELVLPSEAEVIEAARRLLDTP